MASITNSGFDGDFGGDLVENKPKTLSGSKRRIEELQDGDDDDLFGSNKDQSKAEESASGVTTGMILSLRESLQTCQDSLASCQNDLEVANSEIQQWHASIQDEPFMPIGISPEPKQVIDFIEMLKKSEKHLKEQLEVARRKEGSCILLYAKREQDMAEMKSVLKDLKAQLKPPSMQARRLLLDPAIYEEFLRLKNLIEMKNKNIKELQDNISAVSFTPQSKMGKMIMAKCRTLQEENEEIGHQAAEGKMHDLTMKLALQKSQYAELKSQFGALYKKMDALTNDFERSNNTVFILQEKLEKKENELKRLKNILRSHSPSEEAKANVASNENVAR